MCSLQVSDLETGKCYIFRVRALNKAGVGPPSLPSDPVVAKTKPGMKLEAMRLGQSVNKCMIWVKICFVMHQLFVSQQETLSVKQRLTNQAAQIN